MSTFYAKNHLLHYNINLINPIDELNWPIWRSSPMALYVLLGTDQNCIHIVRIKWSVKPWSGGSTRVPHCHLHTHPLTDSLAKCPRCCGCFKDETPEREHVLQWVSLQQIATSSLTTPLFFYPNSMVLLLPSFKQVLLVGDYRLTILGRIWILWSSTSLISFNN